MPAIDHLVYASPDLAEGIARIEALTRVRPQEGGVHPGVGTRNALVGLGDDCYLEVVGIDPDQPAPDFGRPFGIDDRQDPGLVAWAIHPTRGESLADVAGRLRASGFDPGEPVTMSRTTPAGEELNWRLTFPIAGVGALPFVIDWGDTESPARSAPQAGRLDALSIHHPAAEVQRALSVLDVGISVAAGPERLVAAVQTTDGLVEIT